MGRRGLAACAIARSWLGAGDNVGKHAQIVGRRVAPPKPTRRTVLAANALGQIALVDAHNAGHFGTRAPHAQGGRVLIAKEYRKFQENEREIRKTEYLTRE